MFFNDGDFVTIPQQQLQQISVKTNHRGAKMYVFQGTKQENGGIVFHVRAFQYHDKITIHCGRKSFCLSQWPENFHLA